MTYIDISLLFHPFSNPFVDLCRPPPFTKQNDSRLKKNGRRKPENRKRLSVQRAPKTSGVKVPKAKSLGKAEAFGGEKWGRGSGFGKNSNGFLLDGFDGFNGFNGFLLDGFDGFNGFNGFFGWFWWF